MSIEVDRAPITIVWVFRTEMVKVVVSQSSVQSIDAQSIMSQSSLSRARSHPSMTTIDRHRARKQIGGTTTTTTADTHSLFSVLLPPSSPLVDPSSISRSQSPEGHLDITDATGTAVKLFRATTITTTTFSRSTCSHLLCPPLPFNSIIIFKSVSTLCLP